MDNLARSLTVSQVSGLIALGNSVVLFTIPLALAFLLIYHCDRTRSAASWSVLSRQIHSSLWPAILQTDSATSRHVHWSINTVAYLNLGLALLGIVSGVLTPLGLRDEMAASVIHDARFEYAPDLSSFGNGTMGRSDMPMSRDCYITAAHCPGAFVPGSVRGQGTLDPSPGPNATATTEIPNNITDIFRKGTDGTTIASPLDIQYRSWKPFRNEYFNDDEPYIRGFFRHIESLLSREEYVLAEGIIADTISGGIGYRNHSLPIGLDRGGEWDEDILWIEPEIACADTNLSLEITLDEALITRTQQRSLRLVDKGGFAHLPAGNPYDDWPDLRARAYRTAWLSNVLSSMVLNITNADDWKYGLNVSVGDQYNISTNDSLLSSPDLGLRTLYLDSDWITGTTLASFARNGSLIANGEILSPEKDYPAELGAALFGQLDGRCTGRVTDTSLEGDSNVECAYIVGAGSRVDGGNELMEEKDSKWEQPIYTCAAATKASIKTVTFSATGTSLQDMTVKSVQAKRYPEQEFRPLWAMEDWWHPGSEGAIAAPLWGLVDDSSHGTPGYNFTRSDSFYLPGVLYLTNLEEPMDMLAAASAPNGALNTLFASAFSASGVLQWPRYNGQHSVGMMSKWRSLSSSGDGIEKVLRLVWTDFMSSTTLGTNSRLVNPHLSRRSNTHGQEGVVIAYTRRIRYDMRFAIPALLLLVIWAVVLSIGCIAGLVNRHPFRNLRRLLNDTSVGRYIALVNDRESKGILHAKTAEWLDEAGHISVHLRNEATQSASEVHESPDDRFKGTKSQEATSSRLLS